MPIHTVQLAEHTWLVLDERVRPCWLIVEGALTHKATGETHIMHRVLSWSMDPPSRRMLSVHDGYQAAKAWCQEQVDEEQRVALKKHSDRLAREELLRESARRASRTDAAGAR